MVVVVFVTSYVPCTGDNTWKAHKRSETVLVTWRVALLSWRGAIASFSFRAKCYNIRVVVGLGLGVLRNHSPRSGTEEIALSSGAYFCRSRAIPKALATAVDASTASSSVLPALVPSLCATSTDFWRPWRLLRSAMYGNEARAASGSSRKSNSSGSEALSASYLRRVAAPDRIAVIAGI